MENNFKYLTQKEESNLTQEEKIAYYKEVREVLSKRKFKSLS